MKKIFTLVFSSLTVAFLHAQYTLVKKTATDIGVVNNSVSSVAMDSSRRIIVVGSAQEGNVYKLCFVRYNTDGTVDTSFGNRGIDTFTVKNILPATYQGANLRSVAVQPDGKIVASGTAWYTSGSYYLSNTLAIRLKKDGTLDSSFGDNGTVRTNINSSTGLSIDEANSIQVQTDGKIVVAGSTYDYQRHSFLVIRYNTDGSVDNSFGSGGAKIIAIGPDDDQAFALKVLDNGKLLITGESYLPFSDYSYTVALVRLKSNGSPDPDFGNNGIVTTTVSHGAAIPNAIAIQENDKIVICGSTQSDVGLQKDILCIRYNANGFVDSSFGDNGRAIIDMYGYDDVANSVLIQSDKKILLGGYSTSADGITKSLALRLLPHGGKDKSFADNSILSNGFYNDGNVCKGLLLSPSEKIIMACQTGYGAGQYISILRYKNSGVIDSSFGNGGKTFTGIGSSEDIAFEMQSSPWDKSLFVAGTANGYWVIAKYKKNTLRLDSSFGLNGVASLKYKNEVDPGDKPTLIIDAELGKIYLAGNSDYGFVNIACLNKKGLPDTTFGNKGIVTYELYLFYGGFGIGPDHKPLLAGIKQEGSTGYNFITKFDLDGSIDSSFGTNGEVRKLPLAVHAIQTKKNDNKILLGGRLSTGFDGVLGALCLKSNGMLDESFGVNGLATAPRSAVAPVWLRYSMIQDDNRKILISGGVGGTTLSIVRFLKSGFVDSSFASNGVFLKNVASQGFTDNNNQGISARCIDSKCMIVTSGIKFNDYSERSRAVLISLENDGSIDSLNNKTGYIDTVFYHDTYEGLYAALIDTITTNEAVIYAAGKARKTNNSDFLLVKIIKPMVENASARQPFVLSNYNMNVVPNPAHDKIEITYTMPQQGQAEIILTDFSGKQIRSQTQYCLKGDHRFTMQLPSLVPGVYYIKINTATGSDTHKILVQ